ncbi:MAG: hypothetical protein ACJ8FY_28415 [Gemmataceae bacterium]
MVSAITNDPAGIPPGGDFICLPCFIGNNGQLREAKQLNTAASEPPALGFGILAFAQWVLVIEI